MSCAYHCLLQQLDSYRVGVFNRLLEKHRQLKEQLAAKEEDLSAAAGILLRALC